MRVAVVDDSAVTRKCFESLLARLRDVVLAGTAANLTDAIRLVREQSPELVFLDLLLEQGTGIEFLEHVRANRQSMHIAVMTNAPSKEVADHCLALGAEWFFDKSCLSEAVTQICCELLRNMAADPRFHSLN